MKRKRDQALAGRVAGGARGRALGGGDFRLDRADPVMMALSTPPVLGACELPHMPA